MGKLRRWTVVPGPISAAEALWYDTSRWSSWVDQVDKIALVHGDYPKAGSKVIWESPRAGRGRVEETVIRYFVRERQITDVVDPKMTARQTVSFSADGDEVRVDLLLEYKLTASSPLLAPLVDLLGVRRAMAISMQRTLDRFRTERLSDLQDLREAG